MVLILDSTTIPSLPSRVEESLGWCGQRGGRDIRPQWSPCASSLRLLGASRVSATLDECFFSSIGWSCSLCAFWFLNGKSLRFPEFCISVSVFDRLCEQAQCCVQVAFFQPFSLSQMRKVVPRGGTRQCGSARRDSFSCFLYS